VHRAGWPTREEVLSLIDGPDDESVRAAELAIEVLGAIRKTKAEAKQGMKTPVARLLVRGTPDDLRRLEQVRLDLTAVGSVQRLETEPHSALETVVELGETPPA
jgi:valyl-tRNA synthetase